MKVKLSLLLFFTSILQLDKTTGAKSDQNIWLVGARFSLDFPDRLRRIPYFDSGKKRLVFLTNNFMLPLTVARIHRRRWQVELFLIKNETAPTRQGLFMRSLRALSKLKSESP